MSQLVGFKFTIWQVYECAFTYDFFTVKKSDKPEDEEGEEGSEDGSEEGSEDGSEVSDD